MVEIVEHQAADGHDAQILQRRDGRCRQDKAVFGRMELQRHERLKSAGHVLQVAEPAEMVDAVLDALDMAVEHRGVGAQPQLVGRAMDFEPGVGVGLAGTDFRADLRVENFGPAAGHAPQARPRSTLPEPSGPAVR